MENNEVFFNILKGKAGHIAVITLNRPQALNALTHNMCRLIQQNLTYFETDPAIKSVVIQGAGDKAFCAGGDIRQVYELGKQQQYDTIMNFFRDEFQLNYQISQYRKPYIALMDGITMGGGLGVSVHGQFRVGTERLMMAMPETGIGFFPDIGATYFLPRCPDEIGTYMGLTGEKIDVAEAWDAKLIDYIIPSYHLDEVLQTLLITEFHPDEADVVDTILNKFTIKSEPSALYQYRETLQTCFSHNTIEAIISALRDHDTPWHQRTLTALEQKSPSSLKITLEALRRGVALDFADCQKMEYILCEHFVRSHDFYEGIRAVLIDKDKKPNWQPASLDKVSKEMIYSFLL